MSDSQTPNDDHPERDAVVFSGQSSVDRGPEPAAVTQSSGEDAGAMSSTAPQSEQDDHVRGPARSRKLVWAIVALLCTAAGVAGSLLRAHAVARTDSSNARHSAQQSSQAIASTVKQELRHEEDIAVGAATYFAGNSKTSPKEFATWVKWARTLRRFPELEGLSLLTLVHPGGLPAFDARITGEPLKPATTSTSATGTTAAA